VCEKKFAGVVVFKKRFEAIVDGNAYAYARPWYKDRRRNSTVLKSLKKKHNGLSFTLKYR
jgi:hypothetical protein